MPHVVESHAHRQVRSTLTDLAREINGLPLDKFELQQLESLNIHIDPLTPDATSAHKPAYFASYPDHCVPEPKIDDVGGAYNGLDDETERSLTRPADRAYVMNIHLSSYISYYDLNAKEERVPWISRCVGDSAFENSGLYKHDQPEFGCYHIAELNDPAYPHIKAVMYNNMVATDSTILYGELISILRIMLTQLRRQKFIHQMVTPVFIISLMGFQARVMEAFFRDGKMVLRPTKLYDFSHGNHNAFKILAQWYIGKPIGITTLAS
ncbi:uncharacterized protein BO80DRAFT_386874 [Aspergillus ibericus CBS 121593]|uniref:Uncharacterized protein n=1 Tax=Aspergillus ibericus CBS 121593 TaxID=1448316 RepID=A0A395GTN3_9EURO|nr:hypothetical protein BO80DRAFT_386874 [Aspergillus ibericus CBS 121593]RAK98796.1 hypothetical protein BO80DRAFT_386874 [Aspergillus ibericus CBS 121593]